MLTHGRIWEAIDSLAKQHGLSTSGLAKRAGLDPTTFNKSKRFSVEGKPRWPSTESLAKILSATNSSLAEFVGMVQGEISNRASELLLPLIGTVEVGANGGPAHELSLDSAADVVPFPGADVGRVYAFRIQGDSMLPAYRSGDIVIVSPEVAIRGGDRVVTRTQNGETLASEFVGKSPEQVMLRSFNGAMSNRAVDNRDISWIARIVWASQ